MKYRKPNSKICDNASSRGGANLGVPQCWKGQATKRVVIVYNEVEKDTLHLCGSCTTVVARDARRHGYQVIITAL